MSPKQASLYAAAKEALDKSLPLLDGLPPSNPDANLEQVAAIKTAVKNHLNDLVNEIGFVGGPKTARVNQYFGLLLININTGAFPSATLIAVLYGADATAAVADRDSPCWAPISWEKSSFSINCRINWASCRSVFWLRTRLVRISAASPLHNSIW